MHKPLSRAALTSAAALAAVVVSAGAASAASLTIKDSSNDTYKYDQTTDTATPAGSYLNTDLVRTTVRHLSKRVVVTAKYVDLKRTGNGIDLMFRVRTNEGLRREADLENVSRLGGAGHLSKPNGTEVTCKGMSAAVDYDLNTATMSIPRTCLSSPRWVQLEVAAMSFDKDSFDTWIDNGSDATSNEPKTWSAKVRRG